MKSFHPNTGWKFEQWGGSAAKPGQKLLPSSPALDVASCLENQETSVIFSFSRDNVAGAAVLRENTPAE
ncbi:hypothetical protein ACFQY0_03720 [Haloferula chungangensis]|uniref:Uncharacterized protein n=1 Tax=Haloferula chungangensis TaxID=1048331 RepID=A0ABW2L1T1_9BACT